MTNTGIPIPGSNGHMSKTRNVNVASLPQDVMEQLRTHAGDDLQQVLQTEIGNCTRSRRELPALEWLLEGVTPDLFDTEEDREWMNMRPVGEELL